MKRDGRSLDHRTLAIIRSMAIERVRAGERPASVIASYGFSRTTIYNWIKAASRPGVGLKALYRRPATGRPRRLNARQEQQVFHWINGTGPAITNLSRRSRSSPTDVSTLRGRSPPGSASGLWTRRLVADRIERRFKIRLGLTAVGELLGKLGLTPQKPLEQAYRRDPDAIDTWRREIFPDIVRKAKAAGAEICFWDDSSFHSGDRDTKTSSRKGKIPVGERSARKQAIRAASAVNSKGAFWYSTYEGRLTAERFVALLRKLMQHRLKPLHLVVDAIPAHTTTYVNDYVASTNGLLTLHLLPAADQN